MRYNGRPVVSSLKEQETLWLEGDPRHVIVAGRAKPSNFECCPDFSCCDPELLQPLAVRQKFVAASPQSRASFLMIFLGKMIEKLEPRRDGRQVKAYLTNGKKRIVAKGKKRS